MPKHFQRRLRIWVSSYPPQAPPCRVIQSIAFVKVYEDSLCIFQIRVLKGISIQFVLLHMLDGRMLLIQATDNLPPKYQYTWISKRLNTHLQVLRGIIFPLRDILGSLVMPSSKVPIDFPSHHSPKHLDRHRLEPTTP